MKSKHFFYLFFPCTFLASLFSSCQPEDDVRLVDITGFSLACVKETIACSWDKSTFPAYVVREDGTEAFGTSSVILLNDRGELFSHLRVDDSWTLADTSRWAWNPDWPGWDSMPEEVDFSRQTILAVSLEETWFSSRYITHFQENNGEYSLFVVSYEDPDAFLPAIVGFSFTVSEVVSFSVPKLDASTRIRLTAGKVETQQEAQRLLDGWLAGAD